MVTNRITHLLREPKASAEPPTMPTEMSAHPFRAKSRAHALRCALQGIREAWESQPNLRLHGYVGVAVVTLGAWCGLSVVEWLWISFAIGLVMFAELMNTAIEHTVDLVVGARHDPLARKVKDVAAGCVLVAALLAVIIGTLTFAPHFVKG